MFHDKVLFEMARRRPRTQEDMRAIPGIGRDKMARHGAVFLSVIANCESDS
ncbi:MAG: HRDC domain-containing protein [Methylocella sp.]